MAVSFTTNGKDLEAKESKSWGNAQTHKSKVDPLLRISQTNILIVVSIHYFVYDMCHQHRIFTIISLEIRITSSRPFELLQAFRCSSDLFGADSKENLCNAIYFYSFFMCFILIPCYLNIARLDTIRPC